MIKAPFKFQVRGEKVQTPKGIGQYCYVDTPNTKFAEGGAGDYTCTILLTQEAAAPIIDQIDKLKAAAIAEVKAAGKKVKEVDDPYSIDEATGLVKFRFKKPAESVVNGAKVKQHVAVADAKGNMIPIGQVPRVGSGSIIKINGFLAPYYVPALGVGVSLKLRGVQIVTLNSFGSGEDAKFEAEDADDAFEYVPGETSGNGVSRGGGDIGTAGGSYDGNSDVDF